MTIVVFVLMAIGTGYDLYVTRKYTRGMNVIYDLERHAKLEQLTGRDQKVLSGKTRESSALSFLCYAFLPGASRDLLRGTEG